jgi:hypothetical protein
MSHANPRYVAVSKAALTHLLKCAEMVDDFHELRHAAAAVKKSMLYNEICAELERREERYCIGRE